MAREASHVTIVGIGASAGGIEALKEFFDAMPADSGFAFVVIQHLDPNQPSHMAQLLSKSTGMKVAETEDGAAVQANCVYTIPPNKFLLVKDGKLHVTATVRSDGLRMPIDFFFRSLAQDRGENAIAVLFSGSGSDGTLGIREVHGAGGLVIVQDPKTAQFDSMIQHALVTGMVDRTLPVREIPGAILHYVQHNHVLESRRSDREAPEDGIRSILDLLASQSKNDFRCYKPTTIQRRIQRRMGLAQINELSEYHQYLSEHPEELAKLSKDMLIGVTSFFRDPEAFEELRAKAIAPLVQEKNSADPLRAWVAGCATGEEAYSIVMLFMEEMARARKSFKLQVFASDIDAEALKAAREGIYSESIASDISEERLARFFVKRNGAFQVDKQVREAVTFASHNVLLDPPFLNLELLSCRNLLIYLEPEMQKKVFNLFAFAVKPGGYLFLGKSENPLEQRDMFEPAAKNSRIFRRNHAAIMPPSDLMPRIGTPAASRDGAEKPLPIKLWELNQQVLLEHFKASVVLVDKNGDIRHFYGPTHRYLSHRSGDASLGLFHMVENRHASQLRLLLERAAGQNHTVRLKRLEFSRDGAVELVDVTVTPVVDSRSRTTLFAVIFEDRGPPQKGRAARRRGGELQNETVIAQLEADNRALKEQLQSAGDSFQVAHEELTAANEEVMAINEELQSTNEELVTSKEELQSLNEELITTNNQLTDKVEELGRTNDDLANFLNTSEVRTVFLDRKLAIRRFTPSVAELMNLLPLDVGRPVSHISTKLIDTDLVAIAAGVLKTLVPAEKEVLTADGQWYLLSCLPYRTADDAIDGVVYTFTDVSRLKRSEQQMVEAREYAENILHTTREPLLVLDRELRVMSANRAFYATFQVSREDTESRLIYELGNGQWDIPELRVLLDEVLPANSTIDNFEVTHEFPNIGPKVMSLNARRIDRQQKDVRFILLGIADITERKRSEERIQDFRRELEQQVAARTAELEDAHRASLRSLEERNKLEDQLRQAQKMESLGTLAAGVAHDLNNILNIIQGYASILGQGAAGDEIRESVEAITETTVRGTALVQQLLTLSRKNEAKLESVQVNTLIQRVANLIKETFPKTIEIDLKLARALPPIMADPNQIAQVLLNLCVNARDAMQDGGRLTITTALAAESYVRIEVADTGVGIDESIQKQIFDPFFTTKAIGEGTGLGLAVVYGIVKNHKGLIRMQSAPSRGTAFSVYFPVESAEE